MLLGQKMGLDPAVLASVVNSSTGACWACSVNNPVPGALADKSPPCDKNYEGGFATALMLKVFVFSEHEYINLLRKGHGTCKGHCEPAR